MLGHRGARATRSIPENTLPSFDLALEHGCDGFEFDVRQSADHHALICHDPTFHGVAIAEAPAADLAALPTLQQVLARYQASAFLDIEIKVHGLEAGVLQALQSHPPARGFVVTSFLPEVLHVLRQSDTDLPLGLICETPAQLALWNALPAQFVMPHVTLTDIDLITAVHAAGKKLFTWTVNRPAQIHQFIDMGVDGIISDDTEMLGKLN
jgi:glycerophosphoryl diester phosphodiesterase